MTKKLDPVAKKNLRTLTTRQKRPAVALRRQMRYGVKSFIRNSWLSVAATAVMVITLLIIGVTAMADRILLDTVADVRDKIK